MFDPIGVVFQMRDQASGQIGKLQNSFEQLHGASDKATKAFNINAKHMAQGMSLMAGGAMGGKVMLGLANDATTFEASLTKMASAAAANTHEVQQLSDKALELGVKFEFSPDETIMGMKALASAGLNVRQILSSVPSALQLASAAAGEISIPQAAETLTAAMKGYGKTAADSGQIIDTLAKATQISNLRFSEFQESLGSAAGKAMVVNQSFETTLATLGLLRNTGLRALSAAEKFKMTLQTLIQPQAAHRAAQLGIALRGPEGKLRQLDAIAKDLIPRLDKLTQKERETTIGDLFGSRSMEVFQAIKGGQYENAVGQIFRGADALAAMRGELLASKNTALDFQKAFLNTTEGSKKLLEGAWQTLRLHMGKPLLDPIKRLNRGLLSSLESVLELCNQSPKFSKLITGTLALGSGFALVVGGIIAAKGALAMLAFAVGPVTAFACGMGLLLLKGTLLAGGLALAFKAVKNAYDSNLGGIANTLGDLGKRLSLLAQTAWGFFSKGEISDHLKKQLDETGLTETVGNIIRLFNRCKAAWEGFKQGFSKSWNEVSKPLLNGLLFPMAKALKLLRWSLGGFVSDMDKADGGLEKHSNSLLQVAKIGNAVGLVLASLAGGIAVCFTLVADAVVGLVAIVAAAVRGLSYSIERLVHGWNIFRDSSLGNMLFGARKPKPVQLSFLFNGPQDLRTLLPKTQSLMAAETMTLLPPSSDPLIRQAAQQGQVTPLPPSSLQTLFGPRATDHMAVLTHAIEDQRAQKNEMQHAQQATQAQESMEQALREIAATRKEHMQMPPIQLIMDGRQIAEVVNAHNLRKNRHSGEQG